jgi:hypothetical protein
MGQYRDEDEGLIGLARQLTDAYGEARTRDDQDYACDEIAAFLAERRLDAPSEALLAILDLPLTAETFPLVDEAQSTLAHRGPSVVERLLSAALGDVYDQDGSAPERAAETLDRMDRREAAQGLTEVLCGGGDDELKGAAVDALVALGAFAEPSLASIIDDPSGGEWAQAALEEIRYGRAHPDEPWNDDAGSEADEEALDADADAEAEEDSDGGETGADEPEAGGAKTIADAPNVTPAGPREPAPPATSEASPRLPDQTVVDGSYEDFLRRFEQEAGDGPGGEPAS